MDPTLTRKTFLSRIGQARLCLGEASDYATGLLSACADDETPNVLASIITAFSALSGQLELSQRELEDSGDVQILKQLTPVLNNYRHLFRRVDESISMILAAYEAQPECFVSRSGPMDKVKSLYVQFIADEGEYLRGLDTLVNVFCARLTADEALSKADENTIFSLFPELLEGHKKFLKDLKVCLRSYPDVGLGSIITSTLPLLRKYTAFSVNSSASAACLERVLKESKSLASLLKSIEKERGLSLKTLLTRPLTRLEEYLQFLEEYRKTISPVAPDFSPTEEAIDGLQEIIDTIEQRGNVADNLSRLMDIGDSIQGLGQNLVQPDRRFIHGGQLSITPEGQKKPSADYVFMFNDMLLYCQTTGKERLYVGQIWMHTLSVQPITAAGDSNASPTSFTIVDGKNKYTATTSSEDQTKNWIFYIGKAIREVERTRKVFGVPLKVLMRRETDSDIPMIVDKVVHFIYDYGINKEGLFRQTGRSTQIEKLKDQLNQGKKVFFSENMDVHSVADLFKHWLRELPDPLLTWQAYPKCSAALEKNVGNPEQLVQDLAQIVDGMPRANKYVTQHLLKCLKAICDNEVKTKMNPGNLAVVFASNILRNGDPNANPFDMKYFETVNEIFKTFIVNYDQIFGPIEAKRFKISKRADRKSATVSSSSSPLSVTVAPPSPSTPSVSLSSSSPPASSSVPLRDRERRKSSSSFHRASVLRASSDSSDSIKSGIMTVHNKKKWSTRFCVLQQGSITLYKGHKERRATARLLLIGHQVTPMDSRPFSFTIELPDGSKTNFSCKSAEEQDVWMTCIREASSINIPLLSPKSPKSLF